MLKKFFAGSWKTTVIGIGGIVHGAILWITGDKEQGIQSIAMGFGLLFAKDANK